MPAHLTHKRNSNCSQLLDQHLQQYIHVYLSLLITHTMTCMRGLKTAFYPAMQLYTYVATVYNCYQGSYHGFMRFLNYGNIVTVFTQFRKSHKLMVAALIAINGQSAWMEPNSSFQQEAYHSIIAHIFSHPYFFTF